MILSNAESTEKIFKIIFKKILAALKVEIIFHQNSLFDGLPCIFASKPKNRQYCTVVAIETVLCIVKSFRLLQLIDMILGKLRNTQNIFQKYFAVLFFKSQDPNCVLSKLSF